MKIIKKEEQQIDKKNKQKKETVQEITKGQNKKL